MLHTQSPNGVWPGEVIRTHAHSDTLDQVASSLKCLAVCACIITSLLIDTLHTINRHSIYLYIIKYHAAIIT